MPTTIRAIGTAVPPTRLAQNAVRDLFLAQPELSRLGRRIVGAAFDGSAVETRHSALVELSTEATGRRRRSSGTTGTARWRRRCSSLPPATPWNGAGWLPPMSPT